MRKLLALPVLAAIALVVLVSTAQATTVVVVTNTGDPIPAAKVYLMMWAGKNAQPVQLETDAAGKVTCTPEQLKNKTHYLVVAKGYGYAVAGVKADAEETRVTLWPERVITGKIVDEKGKPLAGARIRVERFAGSDSSYNEVTWFSCREKWNWVNAVSGKDGSFTLTNVPDPGGFTTSDLALSIRATGRAVFDKYYYSSGIPAKLRLVMPPACALSGTLRTPTGLAPKDVELVATSAYPEFDMPRTAKTDESGRFELKDLPPGKLTLTEIQPRGSYKDDKMVLAEPREWVLSATETKLVARKPNRFDPVATKGALIRGKVVQKDGDKSPTRGYLNLTRPDAKEGQTSGLSLNDKGEFAVRVPAGKITVTLNYCQFGEEYVSFRDGGDDTSAPSASFVVADGETRSDVVLSFVRPATSSSSYEAMNKPIPAGFRITPGTYALAWDREANAGGDGWRLTKYTGEKAKARILALPKLKSKKAACFAYQLDGKGDDGLLFAVFDESNGTGKGFDTVYVDTNRNRDLSGEKAITFKAGSYVATPWQSVSARQGDGPDHCANPVQVRWRVCNWSPQYLERKGAWRARIDSTAGKIDLLLPDSNANGIYNDTFNCGDAAQNWQVYDWGDCAFADTNGLGSAIPQQWGPHVLIQGGVANLANSLYTVKATKTGNSVAIEDDKTPAGTLLVQAKDINGLSGPVSFLNFVGTTGIYNFRKHDGSPIKLPAGKYMLRSASFGLKAADAKPLEIGGMLDKLIEIEPDRQTAVDIGGSLSLKALADVKNVVLVPGEDTPINWQMAVGSDISGAYVNSSQIDGKKMVARFDGSEQKIQPQECPGGG